MCPGGLFAICRLVCSEEAAGSLAVAGVHQVRPSLKPFVVIYNVEMDCSRSLFYPVPLAKWRLMFAQERQTNICHSNPCCSYAGVSMLFALLNLICNLSNYLDPQLLNGKILQNVWQRGPRTGLKSTCHQYYQRCRGYCQSM